MLSRCQQIRWKHAFIPYLPIAACSLIALLIGYVPVICTRTDRPLLAIVERPYLLFLAAYAWICWMSSVVDYKRADILFAHSIFSLQNLTSYNWLCTYVWMKFNCIVCINEGRKEERKKKPILSVIYFHGEATFLVTYINIFSGSGSSCSSNSCPFFSVRRQQLYFLRFFLSLLPCLDTTVSTCFVVIFVISNNFSLYFPTIVWLCSAMAWNCESFSFRTSLRD